MLNSVVWLKDDFRTINNPAISSLIDEKRGTKKLFIYMIKLNIITKRHKGGGLQNP